MNTLQLFPIFCLMFGSTCGMLAMLLWIKERRDAASNWHLDRFGSRREVIRQEDGTPLCYVDPEPFDHRTWKDAA